MRINLSSLEHPLKPLVEAIRGAIREADPAITEGVKWNSASFYRCGWFATINLRPRGGVQVVLHHGAKVQKDASLGRTIDDPTGLLKWLSADRAVVGFTGDQDFASRREAFVALIRQCNSSDPRHNLQTLPRKQLGFSECTAITNDTAMEL